MTMTYKLIKRPKRSDASTGLPLASMNTMGGGHGGNLARGWEWWFNSTYAAGLRINRQSLKLQSITGLRSSVSSFAGGMVRQTTQQAGLKRKETAGSDSVAGWAEPADHGGRSRAAFLQRRRAEQGWRARGARLICWCLLMSGMAVLAGCSINPATGRGQFLALPVVHGIQADLGAALAGNDRDAPATACLAQLDFGTSPATRDARCIDVEQLARFKRQVERIGSELGAEANRFAPESVQRIGTFQIGVVADIDGGTGSNSRGRIAISSQLARLDPTDDVVAFLIAREMGHVIARHDEEDAGARMAFSALTALVPGASMIARFVASTLGSFGVTRTWARQQRREADDLALSLLARTDRSRAVIALNLRAGLARGQLRGNQWSVQLVESIERVNAIGRPRPAGQLLAALERE
jgi:hypothetical protein